MIEHNNSTFINHEPCSKCGSTDANGVYDDGHSYCFSCNTYKPNSTRANLKEVSTKNKTFKKTIFSKGKIQGLPHRKLSEETCRKFGYLTTADGNEMASYRDKTGAVVAYKIRTPDKNFSITGNANKMQLFGQHLWNKGKKLVITEGEIDAMSVSQIQGHRWATVSLPNGCTSAKRSIQNNWDYVNQFEEVVLMFDMDDQGQKASQEVAELLPVGKTKIARLPMKDANECLLKGKSDEVITAIFQAKDFRPDGIVVASDIRSSISLDDATSAISYPYEGLNKITKGLRTGELVTFTAGSGIGKSTLVREIAYSLHMNDYRSGMIMLEESNKRTILGLLGIHLSKNICVDRSSTNEEEILKAFDEVFTDDKDIYLYDHFGSTDVDLICNKITFMAKAMGVKFIILDHISILVSGLATNDERKLIDMTMTKLRSLVQELDIGLIIVSHLKRPEGDKGHEDGVKVRLGQLRGSHSIAQLSDICVSLQVNADNPDSNERKLFVLKNRFTGETGFAGSVFYDHEQGRLLEDEVKF
tara:strand:- start:188 stop:1777 length:1590 start_codon:yes stop_codon:yes gene_type:complete